MSAVTDSRSSTQTTVSKVWQSGGPWLPRRIEPSWWTTSSHDGRPMFEALRRRDITVVFRFLKSRGWSSAEIAAATGLSENRVRAVIHGRQVVTSYDVLERIALGLSIDRGFMGLAYAI